MKTSRTSLRYAKMTAAEFGRHHSELGGEIGDLELAMFAEAPSHITRIPDRDLTEATIAFREAEGMDFPADDESDREGLFDVAI